MEKFEYCSKCGAKLQDNNNFCSKCGVKLNEDSGFMSWKIFLLALLVAGILIFALMRKEIMNCITPTTSVDLNSISYLDQLDNDSITGIWEVMITIIVAIVAINEWTLYKKYINKRWKNFRDILDLICGILFAFSIEGIFGGLLASCTFLLVVLMFILLVYHESLLQEKKQSKLGPKFWKMFRGIVVAILTVFVIFDSFVIFETDIVGKTSYEKRVYQNREVKGKKAVKQIREIFSNCELKLNGETAIDYQNCTLHMVQENGPLDFFEDHNLVDSFEVYMDTGDEFQYYPSVIADDNAQGIIGTKSAYGYMYLDISMTDSGKLKIKIQPLHGNKHNYKLKVRNGIPSLDGTLDVYGCAPAQASFTLAN